MKTKKIKPLSAREKQIRQVIREQLPMLLSSAMDKYYELFQTPLHGTKMQCEAVIELGIVDRLTNFILAEAASKRKT